MVNVDAVLDEAKLKNPRVREYVKYWAELTGASRIEVVNEVSTQAGSDVC